MCTDVEIAEVEPGGFCAVRLELVLDAPALAGAAPAALLVVCAAEGVHAAVQVRRDAQPVQRDVVAGVDDRGDRIIRPGSAHSPEEPGTADPAGENGDAHVTE